MESNPKYNIIKKVHPDFGIELYCHNMEDEKNVGNKYERFCNVLEYYCNDLDENNYCHMAETWGQALKIIQNKDKFTCICSKKDCQEKCFIKHKPTKKIFLIGSKCWTNTFTNLIDPYKEIKKYRNKILKKYEKDVEYQKQRQQNIYDIISRTKLHFGKHKDKTFNEIPETYVIWMMQHIDKIHPTKHVHDSIIDFFCKKFNLELED